MSDVVFLSLGSNLGDRERNLMKAIDGLTTMEGFELISTSPIYISKPEEMEASAPTFLNMVIKGEFDYSPMELLTNIENIEEKLGREGKGNYRPRTIDIDILLFGRKVIDTERLTIPHRKMTKRAFVLVPLLQLEPDLVHPVTGKRIDRYRKKKDAEDLVIYKETVRTHV